MTVLGYHIHLVGRPRQGQDTIPVSRSPGQGRSGLERFELIFHIIANSSLNFHWIWLKMHRDVQNGHTQKPMRAEF